MLRHIATGLFAVFVAVGATEASVTPVEKVVELLKKLSAQITEEGKKEAADYDKYACFCKETADNKLYAIEKSTEKINVLDAKITKLNTEIGELNGRISELGTQILGLTYDIGNATATRSAEHDAYLVSAKNLTDGLSAIDRAIEALQASKSAMSGKVELEASALSQIKTVAGQALALGALNSASRLQAIAAQPGQAYESTYHSNEIIATLEELKAIFTKNKNDLDQEEFEANAAYEKRKLGMENEKKFAEKEKSEKEEIVSAKTEELNAAQEDKTRETNEMNMDQNFMQALTADCEKKAHLWDQRSTTRSDELTALTDAISSLESGVEPNYGANKKLVGLQRGKAGVNVPATGGGHWEYVQDKPAKPASFLQLRGSRQQRDTKAVIQKAVELLMKAASSTHSPVLSAAALKVRVSEDHFVKVRGLIKDMVARLEMDAQNEATTKSYCDTNMATQTAARDTAKSTLEDLESQISATQASQAQLEAEIAELSKAVAQNTKTLNEAASLRNEESAANNVTLTEAGAGKEAVELAISILQQFYDSQGAFIQTGRYDPYVAPNATREGKTLSDMAPKVFDDEYSGKQEESKGIIGLLQVILSDFERTETTVTTEETAAQMDFEEFESDTNTDTATKNGDIATKEQQVSDAKDLLVSLQDQKMTAQSDLDLSLSELETLKKMCVDGEETYEERVAKREKEIASLKEALNILENWQG